jgi:PKD repeat protein
MTEALETSDQGFKKGYDACQVNLVADISARPTSGKALLRVYFTDEINNDLTVWKWNIGGYTSQEQNPLHKYLRQKICCHLNSKE